MRPGGERSSGWFVGSCLSTAKASSSVGSVTTAATPALGVTDAFQVPFLLSVLFLVTQPESCFTEAGRAPAN